MVVRIDHIGIVVKDLKKSLLPYRELLGLHVEESEELEVGGVVYRVAMLPIGDVNLELVETAATHGLAAEFLKKHGEGIHHIAVEVEDLEKTFHELRSKGTEFVWDEVKTGSKGSKVAYFKAEEFNGVYIELIQRD